MFNRSSTLSVMALAMCSSVAMTSPAQIAQRADATLVACNADGRTAVAAGAI
jgi:hypothetical protein